MAIWTALKNRFNPSRPIFSRSFSCVLQTLNPFFYLPLFFLLVTLLTGCEDEPTFAPVTEVSGSEAIPQSGMHQVAPGESLYEISWRYGMDYRIVAELNHIQPPFSLQTGQMISLHQTRKINTATFIEQPMTSPTLQAEPNYSSRKWIWPAKGRIVNAFSATNKGLNIAGLLGEPIYAAAAGKVVYSGNGLRGYGKLIIIKHNSLYLSAYAHNNTVLVAEGDWVRLGQKIAEMGNSGSEKVMLHFEIRKAGKPINPLSLFQERSY